eukprot:scaffold3537_cov256-Pinguiococcus_pyrenoidosus.AAC.3
MGRCPTCGSVLVKRLRGAFTGTCRCSLLASPPGFSLPAESASEGTLSESALSRCAAHILSRTNLDGPDPSSLAQDGMLTFLWIRHPSSRPGPSQRLSSLRPQVGTVLPDAPVVGIALLFPPRIFRSNAPPLRLPAFLLVASWGEDSRFAMPSSTKRPIAVIDGIDPTRREPSDKAERSGQQRRAFSSRRFRKTGEVAGACRGLARLGPEFVEISSLLWYFNFFISHFMRN